MPGGQFDSSKTRVTPVFDQLRQRTDLWVQQLLALPQGGVSADTSNLDLTFQEGYWGSIEHGLNPPVSLLSWLVRTPPRALGTQTPGSQRARLAAGDPATVQDALRLIRSTGAHTGWYVLEGLSYPDVLIETPSALVVIEGKRTEGGATTHTTFMPERHQIWRHIDAAWEIRGSRQVFGFFVVESASSEGSVPALWSLAVKAALEPSALEASFPHRSMAERAAIAACLVGVTTWQAICNQFGIAAAALPHTVSDARS